MIGILLPNHRVRVKSFAALRRLPRIAIHEVGHAVVAHVVGAHVDLLTISHYSTKDPLALRQLKRDGIMAGFCRWGIPPTVKLFPDDDITVMVAYAGVIAERTFGYDSALSTGDGRTIDRVVRSQIDQLPVNERAEAETALVERVGTEMYDTAAGMIERHLVVVHQLVLALFAKRTIYREEFLRLFSAALVEQRNRLAHERELDDAP